MLVVELVVVEEVSGIGSGGSEGPKLGLNISQWIHISNHGVSHYHY